ncbi:hypothetical protein LCGC14_1321920 [marine sediment metagenome]|uniref:Uncharacterized protein n=1 Tax=marine sediment metagenome TaxID=412755 RepID=A0A0F9NLM8_9ZZZZ
MKINTSDIEKINKELKKAQKRASARTCSKNTVYLMVTEIEQHLTDHDIPKRLWAGIQVEYAEHVNCNAYNKISYSAQSTRLIIERFSSSWFLIEAGRVTLTTRNNAGRDTSITIPEHNQNEIKESMFRNLLKI